MRPLRNVLLAISASTACCILVSCGGGASDIDLYDINRHRAYQDSALLKYKNPEDFVSLTKQLITEYQKLDENRAPANYNFLIGRLYTKILTEPFKQYLFDSTTWKNRFPELTAEYFDNAYSYYEKSLAADKNHILSMSNFIIIFSTEIDLAHKNSKQIGIAPWFSYKRNRELAANRHLYLLKNISRFNSIDTTKTKMLATVMNLNGLYLADNAIVNAAVHPENNLHPLYLVSIDILNFLNDPLIKANLNSMELEGIKRFEEAYNEELTFAKIDPLDCGGHKLELEENELRRLSGFGNTISLRGYKTEFIPRTCNYKFCMDLVDLLSGRIIQECIIYEYNNGSWKRLSSEPWI